MRKLFTLFLAIFATTCLLAHDFEVDNIFYNILDENNVAVTYRGSSYYEYSNEYSGEVIIPETVTYNGIPYSVTSIGSLAFYDCESLTSVTIGNSVTSIGNYAFEGCESLTSVTIGNSVTSIGSSAFSDCSSLTSITIPNSVTSIGDRAFYNCDALTSINIPEGVKAIEYSTFFGCSSLTSITIPNSVTNIGDYAFYYCSSLTSINIPEGVKAIEFHTFYNCSALTSITIPNSVTSIGSYAFENCSALTSITIPNSVTSIGSEAFHNTPWYNNLPDGIVYINNVLYKYKGSMPANTSIDIKDGTVSISPSAFSSCSNLTAITIPNSVTSIGGGAFEGCSSLTSLTIPNSVTSIGGGAFSGCSSLTSITIPNSVTSIGSYTFEGCSSLISITIPNSVMSIENDPFVGCTSLEYLYIPNSVKYAGMDHGKPHYGWSSITDCSNLKTLIVPADFFMVEDEYYQEVKAEDLPYLPERLESLTINDGTIRRLAWDFINRNYKTLKTIDLATTTDIAIAEEAFKNCYKLENLALPYQLEYIPYMAIAECVKLQSITIPATVTEIEDRAFENCRSIKSIIFEGAAPAQGPAHHAAATGSSLWRIGSWAFYNCHQLQNLTIPEGVTEIGDAAFYGCTYLEDMVLPSTIQEIGDNGFALCAKLQKIHVKAATPPTIQAKTFFDVNRQIPVYVPDNAVEAYKDDPYWQEFDIQGESKAPSAVDNIPSALTNTQKIIRDNQLLILRDGKTYNTMGAEIR